MDTTIEKVLAQFVTRDFTIIDTITEQLQLEKSKIIEMIGDSGSGKSLLLKKLIEKLDSSDIQYEYYLPRIFKYNHFREIVKLSTGIKDNKFDNLIEESQKFNFKNIYDLFYFLTEKMKEEKLLKPKNIIIYEGCHLDNYTLEFIQYLIQYSKKIKIQFII
jgi:ABC-type dipeptide/oligopeptide/nickel transport system ATPase component